MTLTNKQVAGNQRRTLRAMRVRLQEMAAEWDERDQFNVSALCELADKAEEVAMQLAAEDPGV